MHREILSWWPRRRYDSDYDIHWCQDVGRSPPTTCHMPPGALRLHLNKSLDQACKSIFRRGRALHSVGGKSLSHHHRHWAWQRTERQRVYGDPVMTKMDLVTAVADRGRATGSIHSGDAAVDRSHSLLVWFHGSSQLGSIISFHHHLSFVELELRFLMNCYWNTARGAAECWCWALCLLAPPFYHNGKLLADGKLWLCGSFG